MTKSEIFKAAHKLAKVYFARKCGHYSICLMFALKRVIADSKKIGTNIALKEKMFAGINNALRSVGLDCFFTKTITKHASMGVVEFTSIHELNKAAKKLESDQYFGKSWTEGGMKKAWLRSTKTIQVAF